MNNSIFSLAGTVSARNINPQIPISVFPTENEPVTSSINNNPGNARFFGILLGFLVAVLGTAGNGITVWAYLRNKNLQTSFNVLIANLCLVELFFSLVVIPLSLPGYITGESVYQSGFCSFTGYIYYASLASSLHNLVAIAVNRYIGIVKSEIYQQLFTGKRLTICIASIWLTAPLLYLPIVIGNAIDWRSDTLRCAIGTSDQSDAIRWYNVTLNVIFQAVPLIILVVLYTSIFHKVEEVQKKLKNHEKASLRSPSSTRRKGNRPSTSKSGNTSDDTGDEFRPSSLVEGIAFKPVQAKKSGHSSPSDLSHTTHNVPPTPKMKHTTDEEHSSNTTASEDESIKKLKSNTTAAQLKKGDTTSKPPTKRSSLWNILLRNSQKVNNNNFVESLHLDEQILSHSTDAHLSENEIESNSRGNVENECDDALPSEVEFRNSCSLTRQDRRRKSLSAPTLTTTDLGNVNQIKSLHRENKNSQLDVPKLQQSHEVLSDSELTMKRSQSAYYKRNGEMHKSQIDVSPLKTNTSWSVRIFRDREKTNSTSNKYSGDESQPRSRAGTIARKIQDRKSKATQKQRKRRQRYKMLQKKHARERQLVYSSLTICIAFAVCILPTAILYVAQAIFNFEVSAAVSMIVSCIAWLHAVVNPLIYGYLNSQYRREYSRIAKCIKSTLFHTSNKKCDIRENRHV